MKVYFSTEDFQKYIIFGSYCPRNSYPIYRVTYYMKWDTTSWTDGRNSSMLNLAYCLSKVEPMNQKVFYIISNTRHFCQKVAMLRVSGILSESKVSAFILN